MRSYYSEVMKRYFGDWTMKEIEQQNFDYTLKTYIMDNYYTREQCEQRIKWTETKEFKEIQRQQYELFLHKQHDYGPGNISVGTQLQTPEEIKLSLTGLWFRMNDKLQRVKTLLMTGRDSAVKDEPLEDAYLDVSNYGIMATIVSRDKWGK